DAVMIDGSGYPTSVPPRFAINMRCFIYLFFFKQKTAYEIQDSEPFGDSKLPHQCLSTVAHRVSNTREVAFFPEGLVRIQRSIHSDIVELAFCGRKYLGAYETQKGCELGSRPIFLTHPS